MANENKWKIENTGPTSGNELNGLLVKKTNSGYELYGVLGKFTNPPPPGPPTPPSFNNVSWDGQTWNIVFTSLPVGNNGAGTWTLLDAASDADVEPTGATDGDFTAQASGGHSDEDAEAASSAKA